MASDARVDAIKAEIVRLEETLDAIADEVREYAPRKTRGNARRAA